MMDISAFKKTIFLFYEKNKRTLPWKYEADPYKILVSEVMLQQTQVSRVLYKYKEWLEVFPTIKSLANASLRDVLVTWQGLGYNRRGKYLKEAAEKIVKDFDGVVPDSVEKLVTLPGIGHATAAAIVAYAFNKPAVFIETNIRAVYLYFFFKKESHISDKQIAELVEKTLDFENPRDWYYALTDYGNMLKNKKKFKNTQSNHVTKQSRFIGSRRQLRARMLFIISSEPCTLLFLVREVGRDKEEVYSVLHDLLNEGFIEQEGKLYKIRD